MLSKQDFKKIGSLIQKSAYASEKRVIGAVGEMLSYNVLPQIQEVRDKVSHIEGTVTRLEGTVTRLEGTVTRLPDKDFVSRFTEKIHGESVSRDRRLDEKIHATMRVLREKQVLNDKNITHIQAIKIFGNI